MVEVWTPSNLAWVSEIATKSYKPLKSEQGRRWPSYIDKTPFIQKYLNILSNFSRYIKGIILPVTEVGGNNNSVQNRYFTALDRKVKFSLAFAAGIQPARTWQSQSGIPDLLLVFCNGLHFSWSNPEYMSTHCGSDLGKLNKHLKWLLLSSVSGEGNPPHPAQRLRLSLQPWLWPCSWPRWWWFSFERTPHCPYKPMKFTA